MVSVVSQDELYSMELGS